MNKHTKACDCGRSMLAGHLAKYNAKSDYTGKYICPECKTKELVMQALQKKD